MIKTLPLLAGTLLLATCRGSACADQGRRPGARSCTAGTRTAARSAAMPCRPDAVDSARTEFNAKSGLRTGQVDRALTAEEREAAAAQARLEQEQKRPPTARPPRSRHGRFLRHRRRTAPRLRRSHPVIDETIKSSRLGIDRPAPEPAEPARPRRRERTVRQAGRRRWPRQHPHAARATLRQQAAAVERAERRRSTRAVCGAGALSRDEEARRSRRTASDAALMRSVLPHVHRLSLSCLRESARGEGQAVRLRRSKPAPEAQSRPRPTPLPHPGEGLEHSDLARIAPLFRKRARDCESRRATPQNGSTSSGSSASRRCGTHPGSAPASSLVGLETHHQDRRGVGSAHQAPAVGPVGAQAVDGRYARALEAGSARNAPRTRAGHRGHRRPSSRAWTRRRAASRTPRPASRCGAARISSRRAAE